MGDTPSRVSRFTSGESLLSVVLVGRRSLATQRRNRYVAGFTAHSARMAPDLAAALIDDYTQPGDLIMDPFAGTGTALVEAVHLGRNAVGVEAGPGWVALARANLTLAARQGAAGHGRVIRRDATRLPAGVPIELRGKVNLILTSPPASATSRGDIPRRSVGSLEGLTAVLAGCRPILAPSAVVVVVSRPRRRAGRLVDVPGLVMTAAVAAGLELVDCRRAIHATVRDDRFVARHASWRRDVAASTTPTRPKVSILCHDDIAVFSPRGASGPGFSSPGTRA